MASLNEADPDAVMTAIATMIKATFGQTDWVDLGMLTNTVDVIRKHPSFAALGWGDDD